MNDDRDKQPLNSVHGETLSRTRNTPAWIAIFWLTSTLTLLGLLSIAQSPTVQMSFWDFSTVVVGIVSLGGLYGFAYYKPLINVVFWRYFFYLALADLLLQFFVLPLLNVPTFGQTPTWDAGYVVFLIYNIAILYGLNQYAYKRPFIWSPKTPEN